MDRLSSSASTVPSIDDYFEHNMWNPLLELLFFEQANGIFASILVEIDMAMIALSCHFAFDLLCYKEGVWSFFMLWHHCCLGNIVILSWVMHSLQNLAQDIRSPAGTVHSGTVFCLSVDIGGFGDVSLRELFQYLCASSCR